MRFPSHDRPGRRLRRRAEVVGEEGLRGSRAEMGDGYRGDFAALDGDKQPVDRRLERREKTGPRNVTRQPSKQKKLGRIGVSLGKAESDRRKKLVKGKIGWERRSMIGIP